MPAQVEVPPAKGDAPVKVESEKPIEAVTAPSICGELQITEVRF